MRPLWVASIVLTLVLVAGLSWSGQALLPGGDMPIELIRVKQVAQLLSDRAPVMIVDVRSRQEYLIRHIKDALSIPLDRIDARSSEIPRDGLVIFY